jgi:hypothetical protein
MLDMGGAPSASTDKSQILRPPNVSKNSKLQAVAFDFEILTKSLQDAPPPAVVEPPSSASTGPSTEINTKGSISLAVTPDLKRIEEIASLLKVSVDTGTVAPKSPVGMKSTSPSPFQGQDIRAKYASKLQGGLHGVELAKSQVEDALKGGDASGHLAARHMAIKNTAASPNKWMALTGTGRLLSYLTQRCIKIALLPNTRLNDPVRQDTEFQFMSNFNKQLKDIVVDTVVEYDGGNSIEHMLKRGVLDQLAIEPHKILLVSDKDEYLAAAKQLGMITCRLRPKNARRGNVTAHYNSEDVPSVQEVVNEITGISFNAVLNRQ